MADRAVEPCWFRTVEVVFVLALALAAVGSWMAVPAAAHDSGDWSGWTRYHQEWRSPANVQWQYRGGSACSFPASSVHDGVTFSFTDAVGRSFGQMNGGLNSSGTQVDLVVNSAHQDLRICYDAQGPIVAAGAGTTSMTVAGNGVSLSQTYVHSVQSGGDIGYSEILFSRSFGWHAQVGRTRWESCHDNNMKPDYTCSKYLDFEFVLTHELHHVFGVAHPNEVSGHDPLTNSNGIARCSTPTRTAADGRVITTDHATACSGNTRHYWSTAGRTLSSWDIGSLTNQRVVH